MRCLIVMLLIISLSISMISCGNMQEDALMHLYTIYYLDSDTCELVREEYEMPEGKDTVALVHELLKVMRTGEDANFKSAMGEEVDVIDVQYKESQLSLYFSAAYNSRSGTEEILSRAAIVKTLCGIDGVNFVEFFVEDHPLMISGNVVGMMNADSFLTGLDERGKDKTKVVTVYFANKQGTSLVAAQTMVNYDTAAPLAKLLIEHLIHAEETIPYTNKKNEVIPTVPSSTVLRNLTIRDNVCYLDFSKDINHLMKGIQSEVVVYSIVNTLCELPNVNRVQITVEGESQEKYGEMDGFHLVLERKLDFVK